MNYDVGRFGDGFLGAGAGQMMAPAIDRIGRSAGGQIATDPASRLARVASAAAVGGTASSIGGGKFANGAISAGFARAMNDEQGLRDLEKLRAEAGKRLAGAAGVENKRVWSLGIPEFVDEFNSYGLSLNQGAPSIALQVDSHRLFIQRQLGQLMMSGLAADIGIDTDTTLASYVSAVGAARNRSSYWGVLGRLADAVSLSRWIPAYTVTNVSFAYDCSSGRCQVTGARFD